MAPRIGAGAVAPNRRARPLVGSAGQAERAAPASTRLFLAVVASAVFVSVLTGSMVNVLLPLMKAEFEASTAQIGWVMTGFSLAFAVGVPLYGRISDVVGVRRVFTLGLLGFAAGGLICAFAPSLPVLVLGRIVQASGGAAVPALASVAAARVLPPGQRGGALGLIASSVGIGATVGPVIGGAAEQFVGWRLLFVASLLLMLALIPFARRVLPPGGATGERRFDLPGGVLLGLGAGLFLFAITRGQVAGFASLSSWASFVGAALATTGFIWRINRATHPFVSPALFQNRGYVAAVLVGFCAMFATLTSLILVSLLVVEVNGLSTGTAGLVLAPEAAALALLSPFAGRLSDRLGVKTPIRAGLGLMTLSLLFISAFGAGAAPLTLAVGLLGLGVGMAFVQSPSSNAATNALAADELGGGMGIYAGAFFLGAGTGPALIGALLAAREEADSVAVNPLYTLDAAPYSDAFLALAIVPLIALLATAGLRGRVATAGQGQAVARADALPGRSEQGLETTTMSDERDWNAKVIAEFRANGGEVAAPYDDPPPMLLLHTIGARSGREHIVPMRGLPEGETIHVFATAHGSDRNPDWYHNLVANPKILIERGSETIPMHATVLTGAERDAPLARWLERVPLVATVVEKTDRVIPVIRLVRRPA